MCGGLLWDKPHGDISIRLLLQGCAGAWPNQRWGSRSPFEPQRESHTRRLRSGLELAFEFNLVDLAREVAQRAVSRYPRAAKVRRWATVLKPPAVRIVSRGVTGPRRRRAETDWLHKHADQYRGKWVVLVGGELVRWAKS